MSRLATHYAPPRDAINAFDGYVFDEFTVDIGARRLLRDSEVVQLPSRVFDVLVHLIVHRDRSVQKDEIIGAIWDDVIVTDDSLIHAISVLRRALADDSQKPKYIETIPRRGYRFIGTVRTIDAQLAAADEAPTRPEQGAPTGAEPLAVPAKGGNAPGVRPARVPTMAWMIAAAAVLALSAELLLFNDVPETTRSDNAGFDTSIRLFQTPPPGTSIISGGVLSPDSRYLAFVARDDASGETGLWVKPLQAGDARRLPGTEGASMPFWAPDSARLGFFARGKLITTDVYGENPRQIATVSDAAGATWGADDTILFAEWTRGLYTVPALGDGSVETVMLLERSARDIAFSWPQFFPDSRRFLYQISSLDTQRAGAYIGNLDTLQSFKLLDTTSAATFAPPHHVLHLQRDMLIAEELDPRRLELTGHAVVIARGISEPLLATEKFISASENLLAFQHGVLEQNLAWFDRSGAELHALTVPTVLYNPRLAPDGQHLLASSSVTTEPGLWLITLANEHVTRIEVDGIAPVWSPDSQKIAYTSRDGAEIVVRSIDNREAATTLTSDDTVKILSDWTPDQRQLIYMRQSGATGLDLWTVDTATGVAGPLLATPHNESQARVSPDGDLIAYVSDESGRSETYVARFPGFEGRQQVSIAGGGQPQWRRDQGELFFLSPDGAIMASEVIAADPGGFSRPHKLFRTAIAGDPGDARDYYAVDPTGANFLVDSTVNDQSKQQVTIMVNWSAGMREGRLGQVAQ